MEDIKPRLRTDLEFLPIQHGGQQFILVRDHLELVQEGKAVPLALYQLMILMDGTRTIRDLQMELMRQKGGVLVGTDEVMSLLSQIDGSFFLDSERFRKAREEIVDGFASKSVRPCSHGGSAYPKDPAALGDTLDRILASQSSLLEPEGKIRALISPHIDLSVGSRVYSSAYQMLRGAVPSRIVIMGVGHRMSGDLFSLTDKAFETPLGTVRSEPSLVHRLRGSGGDLVTVNDFAHRAEHSIEFQLIFLQHLLREASFSIVPILCGSLQPCLPEYRREAYLKKADPFLRTLKEILNDPESETLLVAGVDFSHVGPKFGHAMPAQYLEAQSQAHDKELLKHVAGLDADHFWEESRRVEDRFNVCGFSALACLLEVLPPCRGQILDYELWHEEATRSAVSFAAVVFTSP